MNLCEENGASLVTLYHITSNPRFKLDPNFEPQDNSISIADRSGHRGIYVTADVEPWVNGHGYWRPFVAEIQADPSALDHDTLGRWGGEIFIPASQFDKLTVSRVMPIDAWCREHYGVHGWLEGSIDREFDTDKDITAQPWEQPFKDWRYEHDVRDMTDQDVERLQSHFKVGHEARLRG